MSEPESLAQVPVDLLRAGADEFAQMVAEQLPMTVPRGRGARWRAIAAGFLARINATFQSMTLLVEADRDADALVALRVLYEHAVTFCWIAIDPEPRMEEWGRWEDFRRLRAHNDAERFGVKVLCGDDLERIGDDPPRPRPVAELAAAVDKQWPEHIPAFRPHPRGGPMEIRSFSGLYGVVYRKGSGLAHATEAGHHRHTIFRDREAVLTIEERKPPQGDMPAVAVPLTAFVLLVYRHHFDWPDKARADALTELLGR